MKILIVRTFPNIINPNQYNVQEIGLAKALTRKGHECGIVLYHGKNKDSIEKLEVPCDNEKKIITIYKLHGCNFLKNGIFPTLHKIVKQYDVIQVHEYDQITSWLYYAWSRKPVVIYHGPYYHEFNKGYNLKCKVFDHTFLKIKHGRKVPCLAKSHAAAEFLHEKGFQNVSAVGVGLDIENFTKQLGKEDVNIPVPEDKFNLLYVGKIEERRNAYFLLKTMQGLCERHSDINCIIVGNGEKEYTEAVLKKARSLIEEGRLQYYSRASQGQLAELYQKAQLMVFPTHYDIFGMVLLEALYFGLPVVSSPNGGADMAIRDGVNGKIIENFEKADWMDAVEENYRLWKDKALTSTAGIAMSWDDIADNFIAEYKKALNEPERY